MYNNFYLTTDEINEYDKRGNSIAKPDFFKDSKKFANKLGFELTGSPQSNRQLAYEAIKAKSESLPANDAFHRYYANDFNATQYRYTFNGRTLAYIKFTKLTDGYNLLASAKWQELTNFIFDLGLRGLNTDNLLKTFIDSNGDYKSWLSGYDKSHCNPDGLAATEKLQKTLDLIFKDKSITERHKIGSIILQYATNQNMSFDELHNTLNK